MVDDPNVTAALIEKWRRDGMSDADIDDLASAATVAWWAHDALSVIAPERATFPRPKRGRGRDASVNVARDIRIYYQVELLLEVERLSGRKPSLRSAYNAVADGRPLTWRGVKVVHLKERRKERTQRDES